ncbi:hypothetical protein [Pseudoduganella rhizocola]|uniref:hypothetical protein n=1 Tax=Pseudoduganella rhizocola TaxID=3382643 RepID=UPI0038B5942D
MSQTAATPADIAALADSLTACAGELHARIMREIRREALGHEEAQTLFDQEVALRLQANKLYVDAAVLAAGSLALPRRQLLELTEQAREAIRRIERTKLVVDIAGNLLRLAAAVAAARPEDLAPAAEDLKATLSALKDNRQA